MRKRIVILLCVAVMLLLSGCSKMNEYGLAFTADGSSTIDLIYANDDYLVDGRAVYVIGGMMMVKLDGNPKMLEMALTEGDISIDDILSAAEKDAENEDITTTDYPDGSREYHYDGFDIIKMNTHLGNKDVYFVPSEMSYYDIQ
ncbi:MAG: hypothetical protein IKK70_01580 [Clostridia bacterium]|nr:hypothetical protein [Clostridia bacterium]